MDVDTTDAPKADAEEKVYPEEEWYNLTAYPFAHLSQESIKCIFMRSFAVLSITMLLPLELCH